MRVIRYSCGHISGPHKPIHVKFGVCGFFIIFYWNIVMKMVKCKIEKLMTSYFGALWGVGHDVIKILNFSAIQCRFNHCLNGYIYRQRYCQIILLYYITYKSWPCELTKSNITYNKTFFSCIRPMQESICSFPLHDFFEVSR